MYNKVILMGRITNELELKTTPNGAAVLSFGLAVDRSYTPKGEERKTDFFNIVAWRSNAEFVSRYFDKGRMILVEGELQTRQYTDKNGNTVKVIEVIAERISFTGEKKETGTMTTPQSNAATASGENAAYFPSASSESDDDYPF